jgi:serine/threonine-protein kinase SRPK3
MVHIEEESVLDYYIEKHKGKPAPHVMINGHPVYESQDDFGELRSFQTIPQLIDFGLSVQINEQDPLSTYPIQTVAYRAPEVLLGTGFSFPAEIWNLGCVVSCLPIY